MHNTAYDTNMVVVAGTAVCVFAFGLFRFIVDSGRQTTDVSNLFRWRRRTTNGSCRHQNRFGMRIPDNFSEVSLSCWSDKFQANIPQINSKLCFETVKSFFVCQTNVHTNFRRPNFMNVDLKTVVDLDFFNRGYSLATAHFFTKKSWMCAVVPLDYIDFISDYTCYLLFFWQFHRKNYH